MMDLENIHFVLVKVTDCVTDKRICDLVQEKISIKDLKKKIDDMFNLKKVGSWNLIAVSENGVIKGAEQFQTLSDLMDKHNCAILEFYIDVYGYIH